jgi:hypothetical protein
MTIYEMKQSGMTRLARTTLAAESIQERRDLQRLLQMQISEILPGVLIIAEEFGEWDDSRRRIDLLGLDRQANLIVIELKRGDTGIHMELQAVRYAAMVSKMTFEQAVATYSRHLGADSGIDAKNQILEFLDWVEPSEDDFAQDVKIVLFSEDYSRELTSSILWLNEKGLEVTCFRMSAYKLADRVLVDFQQILPLKEAEEYQVKVRNKQQVEQTERRTRVPWNGEFYANFGESEHRSWNDARKYGFISAGGKGWFTRTLNVLEPGARVWVNRPGYGYVGVGEILGPPVIDCEFQVETKDGTRTYLDISEVGPALREQSTDPDRAEWFVPVRWIKTVDESKAVREVGLFGNQNSAAKPTAETWPSTVERLKEAFGLTG